MISFPALCPKTRSYSPGVYATKRFNSISGAGTTRLYGSKPFDAMLTFEFLVSDSELSLVFECWHDAKGDAYDIKLPNAIFTGMKRNLFLRNLEWRWASPPQVTSVTKGISTLQTKFIAVLEASP